MRAALLCLILLLFAAPAAADPARTWAVAARTAYAYLGPRERPTGGMLLAGEVTREMPLGASGTLAVGGSLSAFGFDSGGRWTAILGGPLVAARTQLASSVYLGADVHLDAGRLPTCTRWGLCMLYSGLFPAAGASVRWEPSPRVALDAGGAARWVRTLAWSGAGGEGGIVGTILF